MKLVITTTFTGIDETWFAAYLKRLAPHLPIQTVQLEMEGFATLASADPTNSGAMAVTTYQVVRAETPA